MRISRRAVLPALFMVLTAAPVASAQWLARLTNPRLDVPVTHAPGLGMQVNKVAFAQASGAGAAEFVDALTSRFVASNVEVLERARLDALLSEQNFSLSGHVDQASATAMGKIIGPTVLIFVTGTRYDVDQKRLYNDWKDRKGGFHRTHISRTQAFVRLSIRSVDLATGRIFAARVLQAEPMAENKVDDTCCAEFPEAYAVLDVALRQVVEEAARMFVPWKSVESVYFFDDKACDLKSAYAALKSGDQAGALARSKANVETCKALPKPNPKALAHAHHNVGMSEFILGRYGAAIAAFQEAQQVKPADIHLEAMSGARLASGEALQMQRIEQRMTIEAERATQAKAAAAQADADAKVTNEAVVQMHKAGLPAAVILSKIRTSGCRFDTNADALIALKKASVPDDVIVAMMECSK